MISPSPPECVTDIARPREACASKNAMNYFLRNPVINDIWLEVLMKKETAEISVKFVMLSFVQIKNCQNTVKVTQHIAANTV